MPNNNSDDELEKNYANWIHRQKQSHNKEKLSEYQINKLEKIDGWIWSVKRGSINKIWIEKFENFEIWFQEHGMPKETSKNNDELIQARWLRSQVSLYQTNSLHEDKVDLLTELLGDLFTDKKVKRKRKSNKLHIRWMDTYEEVKKWLEEHDNKIPIRKSDDETEKRLGRWIESQKTNYNKTNLDEEYVKLLEELSNWKWAKKI